MDLNLNTALFLVNDKCKAVWASYQWFDENGYGKEGKLVEYGLFKTFDTTLVKGDIVLCETQQHHKMSVMKIWKTEVEVDLDFNKYIPWVLCKIESTQLDALRNLETGMIEQIKKKDKERKRAELAATMLKDYGEEIKNLVDNNVKALTAQ